MSVSPPGRPKAEQPPLGAAAKRGGFTVDWTAPWLAPYLPLGPRLGALVAAGSSCAEALNSANPPLRFVPQRALPEGIAYEQFIFETRQVPTRDNLHDFFNGLCWLHCPQTKAALNRLQAAQIAQTGVGQVRGAVRDALTVFDENAAFFTGPDALWQALQAKDWQTLFISLRPLWDQAQVLLFGHALLEKLLLPRKPITAHVYRAPTAAPQLDAWMAAELAGGLLARSMPSHLPVLGVPGWWPGNADAGFYQDAAVFRPPRRGA